MNLCRRFLYIIKNHNTENVLWFLHKQYYLFENWGAFLAFLRPYFLLSLTRESRVRRPDFLTAVLTSPSVVARHFAIPCATAAACAENPPPLTVAITSYFSIVLATVNGFKTTAFKESNV